MRDRVSLEFFFFVVVFVHRVVQINPEFSLKNLVSGETSSVTISWAFLHASHTGRLDDGRDARGHFDQNTSYSTRSELGTKFFIVTQSNFCLSVLAPNGHLDENPVQFA